MPRFSNREIRDLILAWLLISLAFGIAMRGLADLATTIWISALTVGLGFLLHELAHKFTAQHYKKFAEFHASFEMLGLALLLSFTGFIIAAPGAVVISGFVSRRQNGIIAAAGPITNLVLALLSLPLFFMTSGVLELLFGYGFVINTWLALFNMIPFSIFDGAKIFSWNKVAYGIITAVSVLLLFLHPLVIGA